MDKRVTVTVTLSLMSLIFFILSGRSTTLATLSLVIALICSTLGVWFLFSFRFKLINLDNKEALYIFLGTLVSLIVFGLGTYGSMLIFYLPLILIGNIRRGSIESHAKRGGSTVMNSLKVKIDELEEESAKREQNQN